MPHSLEAFPPAWQAPGVRRAWLTRNLVVLTAVSLTQDAASELLYKTEGLAAFHRSEDSNQDVPLKEGPYATLLKKLSRLQDRIPVRVEYSPVRIALVNNRELRARLRELGVARLSVHRTGQHIYAQVVTAAGDKVIKYVITATSFSAKSTYFNDRDGNDL